MLSLDLLFELGCEELPTLAVHALSIALRDNIVQLLKQANLKHGAVQLFATPRRLAVVILELQAVQGNQVNLSRGPAVTDEIRDKPSAAVLGFARKCQVDWTELSVQTSDKGAWYCYETTTLGVNTRDLLPQLITQAVAKLPIAKLMRWGKGESSFARPVHWLVLLLGDEVVPLSLFEVQAGRKSFGHRFHHPEAIEISSPREYEAQLMKAFVVADFSARRQIIHDQVVKLATNNSQEAIMPDALLDEVTSIVEWPEALLAGFDEAFLNVPPQALIAAMQSHQKSFALQDKQGRLASQFITVANIQSTSPRHVILGNERVMRARLSDANFFYQQDKSTPLIERYPGTEQVIFQDKLGTLAEKSTRLHQLMTYLASHLSLNEQDVARAALLSKCDLLTGMVGEFPELQGLMGYYYALHDGESNDVAVALNEQYLPRFSADSLPKTSLGFALSLADRLDTLVGCFAIGLKPSGVKDPFKLRRHALAVVRLLVANSTSLNLTSLIQMSASSYADKLSISADLLNDLHRFILERMQSFYSKQGVGLDLVMSVRARQEDNLYDLDRRISALVHFMTLAEASRLTMACKRVNKLLIKPVSSTDNAIQNALLTDTAERNLFDRMIEVEQQVEPLYHQGDYGLILSLLTSLAAPIDLFFEQVLIMSDDEAVKMNRLQLLTRLQRLLQGVADISLIN